MNKRNKDLDKLILEDINRAIDNDDCICKICEASKDKIQAMCREQFGRSFKGEKVHRQAVVIIDNVAAGRTPEEIIDEIFCNKIIEESHFFRFCITHIASYSKMKKLIGGKEMTTTAVDVLKELTGRKERISEKQISQNTGYSWLEVQEAIRELRNLGIKVVSIPGRYKSGYLLNDELHIVDSETWINNVRVNRYGLDPIFKYA